MRNVRFSLSEGMTQVDIAHAPDDELVARFVKGRDQRAFAEIVSRHGAMVMGMSRSIVGNEHDAEDAFQSTFLALAAAAGKIHHRSLVAAWLQQTAVRTCKSIVRMNAKWVGHIERGKLMVDESYTDRQPDDDKEVLYEELARLPAKYRAAIVLCDLEGLIRNEAARRLGVPSPTLIDHVTRARRTLRSRLIKRGFALSAGGLATYLARFAEASVPVSQALISQTTRQALMFAAGKSAAEIGVSQVVFHTAFGVVRAMTTAKVAMIAVAAIGILLSAGSISSLIGVLPTAAKAGTIFRDDFNDGDLSQWLLHNVPPDSAQSGDLRMVTRTNEFASARFMNTITGDVSIRTQIQVGKGLLGLILRGTSGPVAYRLRILPEGLLDLVGPGDVEDDPIFYEGVDIVPVAGIEKDVIIQMDSVDDVVNVWIWPAGGPLPDPNSPTLSVQLEEPLLDGGFAGVSVGGAGPIDGIDAPPSEAVFRYVQIADSPIPIPIVAEP